MYTRNYRLRRRCVNLGEVGTVSRFFSLFGTPLLGRLSAALAAAGISEGLIRLSVGREDANDLTRDLKAGLRAAARERR